MRCMAVSERMSASCLRFSSYVDFRYRLRIMVMPTLESTPSTPWADTYATLVKQWTAEPFEPLPWMCLS